MDVLDKFNLQYEELPNPKSRLYTVEFRRIGTGSSAYIQRILRPKNIDKFALRNRSFLKIS